MFAQFALHERLLNAVAELNFTEPTPVQQTAIPPALEGRDLQVTAQTGSGKTAAFVLPLLNRLLGDGASRARQLPYYPGYEWRQFGTDAVLVEVGTSVVREVLRDILR